jgi:hypothetical protein
VFIASRELQAGDDRECGGINPDDLQRLAVNRAVPNRSVVISVTPGVSRSAGQFRRCADAARKIDGGIA